MARGAPRADLLPIPYFHVVFTLPDELRPLALARPRVLYDLLFRAASETRETFARDAKHLGGELGLTAILHTWGQTLSFHPHLHCVVTGGALAQGGSRWIPTRHPGLLPRARARKGLPRQAPRRSATAPLRPESVLRYLGRYTHRIALSSRRILRVEADQVALRYRDYADGSRTKVLTLSLRELLRRFLLHVLPQGFVRIRHYGLLAGRFRRQRIARCRELLAAEAPPAAPAKQNACDKLLRLTGVDVTVCHACGEGRMTVVAEILDSS